MPSFWTPVPGQKLTYTRSLGPCESRFGWQTTCGGISDTITHFTLSTPYGESDLLFSEKNVYNAWRAVKRLHPLLSARIVERPDSSGFDFIVSNEKLNNISPNEVLFMTAQSDEEVAMMVERSINSEPLLSNDLLGQLWIVSVPLLEPPGPIHATWHVMFYLRHPVVDGVTVHAQAAAFFDILSSKGTHERYDIRGTLEEHLNLHPCIEDLNPSRYSLAKLRWRRAVASVIEKRRRSAIAKFSVSSQNIIEPAPHSVVSSSLEFKFSKSSTKRILLGCHRAGITLGHAASVLAQLAHALVTHRAYIRGFLSDAEWDVKMTEPFSFGGPFNVRSYLDPEWLNSGGSTRGCCAISMFDATLPALPMARASNAKLKQKPSFDDFLSQKQFLFRCRLARNILNNLFKHPLAAELAELKNEAASKESKIMAIRWRSSVPSLSDGSATGSFCNECSSFGNLADIIPIVYPLDQKEENDGNGVRLQITASRVYLRCPPGLLYLSSITYGDQLRLIVLADTSTYDKCMLQEWLNYIAEAMEWYLGDGRELNREAQAITQMARL